MLCAQKNMFQVSSIAKQPEKNLRGESTSAELFLLNVFYSATSIILSSMCRYNHLALSLSLSLGVPRELRHIKSLSPRACARAETNARRTKASASTESVWPLFAPSSSPQAAAPRSGAKCNMFVVSIEIEARCAKGEKARGRENGMKERGAGYRGHLLV